MAHIRHRVGIIATREAVWRALTEPEGLCGWWSSAAAGSSELDARLDLTFTGLTTLSFQTVQCQENCLWHMKNIEGPGAWQDSDLEFHLEPSEEQVFLVLKHYHEQASEEDFQFFMTKWPLFLVSLKAYVETGKGHPFPHDIKIQADL